MRRRRCDAKGTTTDLRSACLKQENYYLKSLIITILFNDSAGGFVILLDVTGEMSGPTWLERK
jgi:hypothetical protein